MTKEEIAETLMEGFRQEAAESGRLAVTRETEILVRALARGLENITEQIQSPNTENIALEILKRLAKDKVVIQQPSREEVSQWLKELSQP